VSEPGGLEQLAHALGVATSYWDAEGRHNVPSPETLGQIAQSLGFPAGDEAAVQASLARRAGDQPDRLLPPVLVVREGQSPISLEWRLSGGALVRPPRWRVIEESGGVSEGEVAGQNPGRLELPCRLPMGYHRLALEVAHADVTRVEEMPLIVVPRRAFRPDFLEGNGRCWGMAVQLYGIRSRRNWGIGDFTDLRQLIRGAARLGGAFVGVNPLHALFPAHPDHVSPYSPSSRLYYNPLYIDIEVVDEFREDAAVRARVGSGEFQQRLEALRTGDRVPYVEVAAIKTQVLRQLYRYFRDRHLADAGDARAEAFRRYQRDRGVALRRFAIFLALSDQMVREGVHSWHQWPPEYRDGAPEALARFEAPNMEAIEFHEYLQWLADQQLERVRATARSLRMGIGLYQDLAVGIDGGGAEMWEAQEVFGVGMSVGAPPDAWNLRGQNWGLPPWNPIALRAAAYRPFIDLLRANMRRAGALRIDHVMELTRLFWIPAGKGPREGTYVAYPFEDLLGILALESVRHRCMVIGEDLGTVPEGFRERMLEAGVLSYRLLYFERESDGSVRKPEHYPPEAAVAVSTHDLPPLSSYWSGADIELRDALGLWPSPERRAADMADRPRLRGAFTAAFRDAGLLGAEQGETEAPVVAAHAFLARTPSRMLIVNPEDVLGEKRQANVPGTVDEHPNWRHRCAVALEDLFADARLSDIAARLAPRSFMGLLDYERPDPSAPPRDRPAIPGATYRMQLDRGFTFDDAAGLLPYLSALGITHLYSSPWLKARAGTTHGYDIVDHNSINPEIGDPQSLDNLSAVLAGRAMGHILDFVPNHMAIGRADNAWWLDVLEWGRASPYAEYFDIDWAPLKPQLNGKVLVPFLGDHYGKALEVGDLVLRFDAETGSFSVWFHDHRLPIAVAQYGPLIRAALGAAGADPQAPDRSWRPSLATLASGFEAVGRRRTRKDRERASALKLELASLARASPEAADALARAAAAMNGRPGEPDSFLPLHRLLERQAYRLAFWHVAANEINYRRFFDINELAGIRVEREEVFEAMHRFVASLIAKGDVQGLRIDHVDGLFHPREYLARVMELAGARPSSPLYLVVEKVLATHETLREAWPVAGTTGYDFLNQVNALFLHPGGAHALTRAYQRFIGRDAEYEDVVHDCKRLIIQTLLGSELDVLAREFDRIAQRHWRTRDYTLETLRAALIEIAACFPVYRTYVARRGASPDDRRDIAWAVSQARKRWRGLGREALDFVESVLTTDLVRSEAGPYRRAAVIRAAMRFQQYTAPVMAKGLEDTAFYRFNRLISCNEVGGDPRQSGLSVAAFHNRNRERARRWPHGLLATATHDTKRGEDARARIDVLSEIPGEWERGARRWAALNGRWRIDLDDRRAPSRNDEYLLYQALVGAWPAEFDEPPFEPAALAAFTARVQAYVVKAAREAKQATSWANPSKEYEDAFVQFVGRLLDPEAGKLFLADFLPLQRRVARIGMLNSIAQLTLKLACPGVPDIYQGTELWDLSLVDPDNRRRPDFDGRRRSLGEVIRIGALAGAQRAERVGELARDWRDGRIKLHVLASLLRLRREREPLFVDGNYQALAADGAMVDRVVAFAREAAEDCVVVAVGRHLAPLVPSADAAPMPSWWEETSLTLPPRLGGGTVCDALTGREIHPDAGVVSAKELFSVLPAAVLIGTRAGS
jgi:(1->4)-alpha-D-glucan 1-alpha-D-glucosylmutase